MNLYIHFLFIGILLMWRNQCILGTNVILKVDKTLCVGKNITLTCQIPSFTSFATWNRNGTAITTCTSGGSCTVTLQPIDGITYYFYGSSTGIEVSFQTHLAEDDVQWICNYNSKSYQYVFDILNECIAALCAGIISAVTALCILIGGSKGVTVVISIIIYCRYTQRVKITAIADEHTKLKSVGQIIIRGKQQSENLISSKQMFNKGKQQSIPIIGDKECSIVALGGESHKCFFETDAGMLSLTFKNKDDLLNVIPGQTINLPTLLAVDPKYSAIQWVRNEREFQNDNLCLTTRVTWSTYGVYNIKMKFADLGLTILIENMRVKGRYWMLIVISVPINVLCDFIGIAITGFYRSTDGYCISVITIVIIAVLCVIVNGFPVVVLVYTLFKRRTGNEKNSRPKPANDATTPPTPSTKSTVSPTIVTSTSVMSGTAPSAVDTTSSTSGTSPSAVITAFSTDHDRRNQKPSKLPDGYDPNISLRYISGDQILKENAEQINLLNMKS